LNKHEAKLFKLNSKAQDCISRVKAQKLIRKADKTRRKITKMSEAYKRPPADASSPQPHY